MAYSNNLTPWALANPDQYQQTVNPLGNNGAGNNNGWGLAATQFSADAGKMGPLGANPTYGGMLGHIEAEKVKLARNEDNRAERVLSMGEETQSWKREDREKEQVLQAGMAQAAQDGGYEGVISYLMGADPERAMKFHDAKLSLDDHIMSNEVMRDIKIPSLREDALLESYEKLGKMGAAILQVPPSQREAAYKQMLPIAKVVNPNMPDNLEEGAPMLLLAAAQATPANVYFKSTQQSNVARTQYAKLHADYQDAIKNGEDPNGAYLQGMRNQIEALDESSRDYQIKALKAQNQIDTMNNGQEQAKLNSQIKVGEAIRKDSKKFLDALPMYNEVKGYLTMLDQDPYQAITANNMLTSLTRFAGVSGAQNENDYERNMAATGLASVAKKFWGIMHGSKQVLNDNERSQVKNYIESTMGSLVNDQTSKENTWKQNYLNDNTVDMGKVLMPSQYYYSSQPGKDDNLKASSGQVPDSWLEQAQNAIKSGADPKAVMARVQQKLQSAQQQQQNKPQLDPNNSPVPNDSLMELQQQVIQNQKQIDANERALNPGISALGIGG